ncbi:MAG: adenylate/guanylate cyclase domain-containing protein [Bellilinea sp.]|jgi:adenylate cyclase
MPTQRVLIVQQQAQPAQSLVRYFRDRGDQVWEAWELGQAEALLKQIKPQLLLFDLHFPGEGWLNFLRKAQSVDPRLKIILTNHIPDVQREIQAKSIGINVFLRHPFHSRWIELALRRLESIDAPTQPRPLPGVEFQAAAASPPNIKVPVRLKITLPYLLLALLFALASAYIITQVVVESVQDRFFNHLVATGRQTSDWMVREEDRLLATLRLLANTQGMADAIQSGDAEQLRLLVLPLAVNSNEEAVEILDLQGVTVFSARRAPGAPRGEYAYARGDPFFIQQAFVQRVLRGEQDIHGDKFAGFVSTSWGNIFYVTGPVMDGQGQLRGVVLVGKSADTLVREMKSTTLGETTLYTLQGDPIASTFVAENHSGLDPSAVQEIIALQDRSSKSRPLNLNGVDYTELFGAWEARSGEDLGVLGVSLTQAFLVRASQVTRLQVFGLISISILLVILIGVYLANLITRPLLRLVRASSQVAQGNLGIKVNVEGNDELSVLAHAFNAMVAGLQEGFIYRDLLGRTVSPEVREQLRQTFGTGNLRLEGQQAVATVLMSDIRGFTSLGERSDPATVMNWLNEYYDRLVPIIVKHGGVVNKFDGDAMLAFFGILPRMLSPKKSARAACQAAIEMTAAINELNQVRESRGDPLLVTGIGVNTGVVIAGGLGARDRLHYTIIGDAVNTAQRLEALTRQLFKGSGAVIGHSTFTALEEYQQEFTLEPLGLHSVKGKMERVMVYRLAPVSILPKVEVTL